MTAAHPLRCETCKNDKCLNFYGSLLDDVQNGYLENLCGEDKTVVRTISIIGCASHSAASSDKVLKECKTCLLEGTRACMYHGYPDNTIPKSCRCKVGIDAQFALDNLKGTFIIKNLRQAKITGEDEQIRERKELRQE